jgi:hypothetical protein
VKQKSASPQISDRMLDLVAARFRLLGDPLWLRVLHFLELHRQVQIIPGRLMKEVAFEARKI